MKTSNFTLIELQEYYSNNRTIFFTGRICYQLVKDENENFKFIKLLKGSLSPGGLPHCKRGRFHAMKPNDSYCKQYGI